MEFAWILWQRHSYGVHSIDFQIYKKSRIENQIMQQKRKSLPARLRYQILDRDNYTCQACGAKPENGALLEIDHIYPVSKGGLDIPANLRTLCKTCNRGKGDKIYGDN
jgi:5-methylcytosine-specific restriction endonuclease McrA